MVERDLRLVELTGGRYHAANVSTAAALERIADAKARGLRVTCDTAPHYFALNENAVGDYRTFAKVSPPLRSEDDRRAVAAAVADGTDRLHRQRPQPARPGLQAPAVRTGGLRHRRPGDPAAAVPRAGAQGRDRAARPARLPDLPAGGDLRPHGRAPGRGRGGRPGAVRPGAPRAHRVRRLPQQVEELALRRPSGPGPGAAHRRRRRTIFQADA